MVDVDIDQFAIEITEAIAKYTEDVSAAIERELDETSRAVLEDVKEASPHKSGDYKKGWRRKKEGVDGSVRYVIYNKDKPGLVHLLEFGHAQIGGGRVEGRPHVRPAYDKHVPAMEDRIERIIRNGGGA